MGTRTNERPKLITRRQHLYTDMPQIHMEQLFGGDAVVEEDCFNVDLDEPYIWGLSGARGSGKSETLAYLGIRALALELPVWSNFPIKFKLLWDGGSEILESRPLMFKDIFTQSAELQNGLILIDEYQDWANALNFMSTQNKLLNSWWAQIRKNQMSFAYASKKLRWIDLKTREETDIEIKCKDAAKASEDRYTKLPGEKIYWDSIDWSGNWTGKPYEDYPMVYQSALEARFIWGAFDTNLRFDIFEAMRGYHLDLTKTVITDKNEQFNSELEEQKLIALFQRDNRWPSGELFATMGVTNNVLKSRISRLIKDMGGREINSGGVRRFEFNPDTDFKE